MPEVSIVIPVYNAAAFIQRAVGSVISQTFTNFELLIVDDCSTDNTLEVIYALQAIDSRVKVLKMASNGGPSAARNLGFSKASGNWIALLDADDAYMFDRLEKLMQVALDTNADLIADNLYLFDSAVNKISGIAYDFHEKIRHLDLNFLLINDQVDGKTRPLGWMKPIFKRSFLVQEKLKYREDLRYAEDFYLYCEFFLNGGKALILDSPYYIYTTRQGELSGLASSQSQTITDFNGLSKVTKSLIDQYGIKLSAVQLNLLKIRIRNAQNIYFFQEFKKSLKNKKLIESLSIMTTDSTTFKFIFKRIVSAFFRRAKR